ncbi:hypothetical protein BD311DRAFT_679081, partial [Dichomitus squalens]
HPLFARASELPTIPPPVPASDVYASAHSLWYIRSVLLLVVFLHTHHHVTFRACNLTLSTLRSIFVAVKLIDNADPMPTTLTTALRRLDLTDRFHVLIECPQCRRLFKPKIVNHNIKCPECDIPLFSASSSAFSASYSSGAISFSLPNLPPVLRYRVENLILSAMTDGPKEPDAEELQHWLELVVDDLLILFYLGIFAPTESRKEGRRMRVALSLEDKKERDEYFKQHGSRWSELMRLPYYDCVAMTVIDPMHNLLLGVVKHQWYSRWIKSGTLRADTKAGTKRELAVLHRFLDTFEAPEWVGRLPLRVGEPAGGSLTADEYKLLMICPGMIILPLIWDQCLPEAVKDHEGAFRKYEVAVRKYNDTAQKHEAEVQALRTQAASPDLDPRERTKLDKKVKELVAKAPKAPLEPTPRMQEDEVPLMLSLGASLKLLLASSTCAEQRHRGAQLLFSYLLAFKRIYGRDAIVPNHHFATHIPSQLEEYGTVYEIWAFLAERLNKTLKSTNQNNRRGGLQEVTMMREFDRHMQVRAIVEHASTLAADASLSTPIGLGARSARTVQMDKAQCEEVLKWGATFLDPTAHTLSYIVLDGRRITPKTSSGIVKVSLHGHPYLAGDVARLFLHQQPGYSSPNIFAEVKWLLPEDINQVANNPWRD